jgi:hypothetical protein
MIKFCVGKALLYAPLLLTAYLATQAPVNAKDVELDAPATQIVPELAVSDPEVDLTEGSVEVKLPITLADQSSAPATSVADLMQETQDQSVGQVTSVSQLSDVYPTDWAFQAVQSLVERYGCIAGYPDGTFRGETKATRYELAAALNACLDQISDRFATKADLETVKALQEEFAAELATLRGRVDGLEARVATVEAQQFSTTTKLNAEVLFVAATALDEDSTLDGGDLNSDENGSDRVFFANRVRLNFDTSFNGQDRLRVRLQSRNIQEGQDYTGTRLSRLGFDGETNGFELDELNYQFKPFKNFKVKIDANAGEFQDNVNTFNPYLASSGTGSLQRFTRFNPIYRQGSGGVGVSFNYKAAKWLDLEAGYLADEGQFAADGSGGSDGDSVGLVGGSYAALAQIVLKPFEKTKLQFGLTYVRAHDEAGNVNVTGSTAEVNLDNTAPGIVDTRRPFGNGVDTDADHLGFQLSYQPADWLAFSGWVGYSFVNDATSAADARLLNWSANLAFPDLLGEGNVGALLVGQQPNIVGGSLGGASDGSDPNWIIQAQYLFQVNKFISITPGVIVVLNPNNNSDNDPIIVPVVRTTFKF